MNYVSHLQQKLKSQQGFSLVELLIAITILAIGLLGIAGLQVQSIRYNAGANTRSVAISIAQGVMEEISAKNQGDPIFRTTVSDIVWDLDDSSAATELVLPGAGSYSAVWSVSTNDPISDIARVTVVVTSPSGRTASLTNFKRFL